MMKILIICFAFFISFILSACNHAAVSNHTETPPSETVAITITGSHIESSDTTTLVSTSSPNMNNTSRPLETKMFWELATPSSNNRVSMASPIKDLSVQKVTAFIRPDTQSTKMLSSTSDTSKIQQFLQEASKEDWTYSADPTGWLACRPSWVSNGVGGLLLEMSDGRMLALHIMSNAQSEQAICL